MSTTVPETPTTPKAPLAPTVRRGLRDGDLVTRSGAGSSSSFDPETRTFEFTLASGKPVKSERYYQADGDEYARWHAVEEQLDIRGAEELDQLVGASILNSHYYYALDAIVGVIESARLDGGALVCTGRLSQRDGVKDIATDIADGIIRSVSVGFDIVEQSMSLRAGQVPLITIKRWKPREASLVAVPADNTARIRSGATDVTDKTPAEITAPVIVPDAVVTPPVVEDVAAIQAEVDAARSALASAEARLSQRSAPVLPVATPAVDAARKAQVDALRGVAQRNGRIADFEGLAAGGASVEELRTVAVSAIATSGGEISVTRSSGGGAQKPALLTRSAYVAHRAGQAN